MFNEEKFRELLKQYGMSIKCLADKLGISTVTLYRKMSGESDFFRNEIQICGDIFGEENIKSIFFDKKVS